MTVQRDTPSRIPSLRQVPLTVLCPRSFCTPHKQPNNRATITEHDRAVLALKAQRKKLEDQTKMVRGCERDSRRQLLLPCSYSPQRPVSLLVQPSLPLPLASAGANLLCLSLSVPNTPTPTHPQLERRIEQDTIVARTLIAQKKKERALLALKKKKLSENQLSSIQSYLMNVEGMVRPKGWGLSVGGLFGCRVRHSC